MTRWALAVVGVALAACSSSPVAEVAPSTTTATTASAPDGEDAWAEDMAAFGAALRRIHPNPFWREAEADFDAELASAPPRLAAMTRPDAAVEVMRLAAVIDGHTGVYPSEARFHLVTLHLYLFDDGLYVVNADDESLVGSRVTAIGATAIEEALTRVRPYAARDNDSTITVVVPMLLMTPEVLEATGIVEPGTPPTYHLETPDGRPVDATPRTVTWSAFRSRNGSDPVGMPKRPVPASLARRDEPFWWTPLDDARGGVALYVQYNQVLGRSGSTSLQTLVDELVAALGNGNVSRVIVDLRNNPGGDNTTYGPFLALLTDDARVNRPGGLYVLIGRQTFSAAMNFATEVDTGTAASFVGEPTGGRPNLYGDVRPVRLPNSGITVQVSSRYWEFGGPDDDRPWIAPDIAVPLTAADFVAGRDAVLEAALGA